MKIYKYTLNPRAIDVPQTVELPAGAKVISAGVQRGEMVLWAEVSVDARPMKRSFYIAFTGSDAPSGAGFICTLQAEGLVFHIYEVQITKAN